MLGRVWRAQHPADCASAKLLVLTSHWRQGPGSALHMRALDLMLGLDIGRVVVDAPGLSWDHASADMHYCPSTGFDCYFLPLSNCTAPANFRDLGRRAATADALIELKRHRIVILDNSRTPHHSYLTYKSVRPKTFGASDRDGRGIARSSHFWMSILMRYLLRPNRLTVEHIIQPALSDVFPRGLPPTLASVFIRWGDKGSEVVKLEDVDAHMAPLLAENVSHVYVGSDSEDAIRRVVATYGKRLHLYHLDHARPARGAENYKQDYQKIKGTDGIVDQMKVLAHTLLTM